MKSKELFPGVILFTNDILLYKKDKTCRQISSQTGVHFYCSDTFEHDRAIISKILEHPFFHCDEK